MRYWVAEAAEEWSLDGSWVAPVDDGGRLGADADASSEYVRMLHEAQVTRSAGCRSAVIS